ncbi:MULTISPECIES: hypothetical protein [unclassified Burkholderia]|uniref:hypothetical protein n=1 Tax=unclassified Burkholderia TaxID=2613784 RepID=UPI000756BFA3|nr:MULTISPECIES: hypothetical protein [unclassified Burkholderia]KUY90758.1 hypothetical protein WS48_25620 [Burkholderia sp. RF7-non_BP1]KUY96988.1 hypothetical protein WS49_21995 [Burkholderia sp. RF7-non_BP4]
MTKRSGLAPRIVDAFERVTGSWRFAFRDYTPYDFAGDLRQHPNDAPAGGYGRQRAQAAASVAASVAASASN